MHISSSYLLSNVSHSFQTLDVVQVQNMAKKAKNTYRCSKILLHKKFKLILGQNGRTQTDLKMTFRVQKHGWQISK